VLPLTILPFIVYSRKVRKASRGMYAQVSDMGKLLHETFTGYRVVKAYNLENRMVGDFRKSSGFTVSYFMRMLRSAELPGPLIEFLGTLGVTAFFIYLTFHGDKTPGDLLAFVGSIFLMYAPIKNLIRLNTQLEQANAASQFIFQLLDSQSNVVEPARPKPLSAIAAPIQLDNVSFAYGEKKALENIQLTLAPGKVVALVGSSGSGKTTLANLLLRFFDPQEGAVRINGMDIREAATSDLRRQIAVVTQEVLLFNDTIRNNILLGRPGATDEEIIAAARHANAHEFIMEKPEGYNALIGERGAALSGGQRQRIAIARAILKNAPILILDEATSALDTESERAVQAALDQLMQDRTTLVIAHRLSTIQDADLIVSLDQGRIVETGTHSELVRRGGVYQKLYELQFQKQTAP
jgi:subfamily B ATP-binding cassette protein MsbA